MAYCVTVLPENRQLMAQKGDDLLSVLRSAGLAPAAPCGGEGRCGKCKVILEGREVSACRTVINGDMTVTLPRQHEGVILTEGLRRTLTTAGTCLAFDIGTTTVAAYLIENGQVLSTESRKNPQVAFGADVVSRIRHASKGNAPELTAAIRQCVEEMSLALLARAEKQQPDMVCVVGNPAMQQLFLGLAVNNLTQIPYRPVLRKTELCDGGAYLSCWAGAKLLTVPDIAGYIGADTVAGILATGMDQGAVLTLLVDIGTNGEMVLGNKNGLVACATAAGPALEGADIEAGMQAAFGAIDHVFEDFSCHVIGEGEATGICGSGLLDAVAVALRKGQLNERGRILNESRTLRLTERVSLFQEDVRQLQQAKGAIAAGIRLMAHRLGVQLCDIEKVYLAGAFGTFMDPASACRTGLIPVELEEKIVPVGNAAGSGAILLVAGIEPPARADAVVTRVEHLELATLPQWAKNFAECMRFDSEEAFWKRKALGMGFTCAGTLEPATLTVREDVRSMCAADQCGAYGKNWTCPPHCGTLEECGARLRAYNRGILLQTVGTLEKTIDTKAYRRTEQRHMEQFCRFAEAVKKVYPRALCLGSGGCRLCASCAYPEPCRFPEKACASMEGYGLFVTQVCRDNGMAYHHGERTVTYTACVLY